MKLFKVDNLTKYNLNNYKRCSDYFYWNRSNQICGISFIYLTHYHKIISSSKPFMLKTDRKKTNDSPCTKTFECRQYSGLKCNGNICRYNIYL